MITKLEIVILAGGLTMLVALAYRLTIGVDLSDEAFYLVTAKALISWGRPFVNVLNLAQTSAILTVPLIRIWQTVLHQHNEGIILWLRTLYLLLSCTTGSLLYLYAKTRVMRPLAMLVAFLPVAWIPFGLPALSYNTIGENFFFIGVLLSCLSYQYTRFAPNAVALALPFVICCVAYPTFPVPCAAFLILLICLSPEKAKSRQAAHILIVLIVSGLAIVAALVFFSGADQMMEAYTFCHAFVAAIQDHKLTMLKEQAFEHYFPVFALIAIVCALINALSSNQIVRNSCLLVISISLVVVSSLPSSMFVQSHAEVTLLAFFVVPQIFRLKQMPASTYAAICASLLAGLTTAFSSGNGLQSLCLGAFPAVCLGLCEALRQATRPTSRLSSGITAILAATCCLVFLRSSIDCIYGTDRNESWSTFKRMPSGPFRFLRTKLEQKEMILALSADLAPLAGRYATIYVAGPPGCYLLSALKPIDPTLWHIAGPIFETVKPSFRKFYARFGMPDVYVIVNNPNFGVLNSLDKEYLNQFYSPHTVRSGHAIYVLKSKDSE